MKTQVLHLPERLCCHLCILALLLIWDNVIHFCLHLSLLEITEFNVLFLHLVTANKTGAV